MWFLYLLVWLAIGVFLTAFLSGRYEWEKLDDDGHFWLSIASAVLWPIALILWALIIPATWIHEKSRPKKKAP